MAGVVAVTPAPEPPPTPAVPPVSRGGGVVACEEGTSGGVDRGLEGTWNGETGDGILGESFQGIPPFGRPGAAEPIACSSPAAAFEPGPYAPGEDGEGDG
jgi:hypothetical protein